MNPIVAGALVGAMMAVGKWSKGDQLSIDNIMGVAGVAVGLAILGSINKQLGAAFGALIVVSVALWQLGPIIERSQLGR